jgi:3-deoxy-D-manno-octulosonate 8-phosphate phosphatase (KDO 8-P phosphatase)
VSARRGLAGLARRLAAIRLLCFDVDGTLTDGGLWIGPAGEEWKRFDVRDGLALVAAKRAGLRVAFVSGRRSTAVAARARDLGVADDLQGVQDKARAVRDLRDRHGLPREAVLFAGDDVVDLPGFAESGVGVAPADARPEVRAAADAVLEAAGGRGAAREVVEAVLRAGGNAAALPGLDPGRPPRRRRAPR